MADVRLTATNPEDSSVVPVACDASGRLLLQELPSIDTIDGDLTVAGKGSFAGGKSIIGNDGSAQFAQGAVDIYANGTVEFTQDVTFDGSATFAGVVYGDAGFRSTGLTPNANFLRAVRDNGNTTIEAQGSGSIYLGANLNITTDPTTVEDTANIILNGGDGSATFAGGVTIGSTTNWSVGQDNWGFRTFLYRNGDAIAAYYEGVHSTPSSPFFLRCNVAGVGDTIDVRNDGSATFAGGKAGFTEEGYLWCTTRRGDTVILDATSNGLASWVEYTPTTRIDDIRDELNAIRGDAAEMPADTP